MTVAISFPNFLGFFSSLILVAVFFAFCGDLLSSTISGGLETTTVCLLLWWIFWPHGWPLLVTVIWVVDFWLPLNVNFLIVEESQENQDYLKDKIVLSLFKDEEPL